MRPEVEFLRAFPQTPATLCCEPVAAWIAHCGVAHVPDAALQRELFERFGFARAVAQMIRATGLLCLPARYGRPGDACVARLPDGLNICGIIGADGMVLTAAAGAFSATPLPVRFIARLPE